ncbi:MULTISPECIES: glycine cleavage system protein R [unclassified Photobacterium]|uniref:glycine cleavage system protein R n=1 Tax=unclassified Photobacterium TaxID=2628852 RepID=UPI000D16C763|nr:MULTISPECIES: glycine cleavage system protein R [unclassified Photobacterium]PSV24191.1 glycine cleavage system transcriptional repressor [Photobacterium sp. GB-56]PSV28514.1 glycine cleavage system transcriptional repressor [Photobacterium sp. GB-72]PSV33639.1 glycine cleavage system transcriptional repressor [Photobacterium sp. GB-27]PSV40491.1 glycine cleavage system transcriptional repressor [Photobacterium sp. GB-210]PSV41371.1 glycine cleavage system transcriptional repressor [Photoba
MEHYLVITAVGTDRPGISDEITHLVTQCGCNIVDSRIALFGSEFTLIMLLSGNNNAISRIESTLPLKGQEHDLITVIKRTSKHQQRFFPYTADFHVEANDSPGLIKQFTHFMASRHIDISTLSANTVESQTVETMNKLILQISTNLPEDCNLMTLQEEFETLCHSLSAKGSVNFISHKN